MVWRKGHYVTAFIPIFGIWVNFILLVFVNVLNELDKCFRFTSNAVSLRKCCFLWSILLLMILLVCIPLIGTVTYNLVYFENVRHCHWLDAMRVTVSKEAATAAWRCLYTCRAFIVVGLLELVIETVIVKVSRTRRNAPNAPSPISALAENTLEDETKTLLNKGFELAQSVTQSITPTVFQK
eukprot:TRINITY_DN19420_c0_g3_i1.p1 TRINITY_DN19420_c0_g3~~TRINITY_DN19420_c0_g3_i1.p1  ORF type:complete len:211 (-),score=4.99 TRINITY_DN19420_c0_g3_i1:159-704(-)